MAYCEKCGSALGESARFCQNCGAPVPQPQMVQPKVAAVVESEEEPEPGFDLDPALLDGLAASLKADIQKDQQQLMTLVQALSEKENR